ncbi:HNH endonuclease signature motif containing protein [Burkholderia vietnamiensis]|uniref:HNH endonuclease n=1 Tax=Burkholderia vietnamiensis TaxID=60552 RepID=UPI0009BE6815
MDYWRGRCCVTGLAVPALLRASHIKPWAKCQSDDERLDVFNGFLLAPHIDALFDGGWISFSEQGGLLISEALPYAARVQLGVSSEWNIPNLKPEHASYLTFHRVNEFRRAP